MLKVLIGILALAAMVIGGLLVMRTMPRATEDVPSGGAVEAPAALSEPGEIIEARRVLMLRMEEQMRPIDELTASGKGDLAALRSAGATIEAMMLAFPHLFPPATNLFDPASRESPTYALPAIWDDFASFRTFAEASERAAATMAGSEDAESMQAAGRSLRASCDGCHARFTRPYTPPKVTQEDLDFDFDSVFPDK